MVHLKIFFGTQFFQLLIKSIVVFIPVMTGIIINKAFIIMILLSSIWFNIGRFINNSMFLWYITDDSISFTIFNCLYINPRMLICTNIKNHQCNYTCYKTNNLGARKIGRFINNSMFLWYITDDSISFTIFNCLYINPRMLICTNIKNHRCNYTCYKTNNLGARKQIFLMPQMNITIPDVFYFLDKIITIKWIILVIKVSVLSTEQVYSKIQFILR